MASDSEDNYDYLSNLKAGPRPLTTDHELIILDSDSCDESDNENEEKEEDFNEHDSDDCLIVGEFKEDTGSKVDKCMSPESLHQKHSSPEDMVSSVSMNPHQSSLPHEPGPSHSLSPSESTNSCIESKTVIESDLSNHKPDIKPDFDVDVKQEIKTEIKTEVFIKSEVKTEFNTESNIENREDIPSSESPNSSQDADDERTRDSSTNLSTENLSNNSNQEVEPYLLEAIRKVKSQHQRPTFDRILVSYNKLKKCPTPILALRSHIESAVRKGLIKAVQSSTGGSTAYVLVESSKSQFPIFTPEDDEESRSFVSTANECSNEESIDFNDYEVDSERQDCTDSEHSHQMLPSLPSADDDNSVSTKSVSTQSVNHNKNREVIRRHVTVPSSCNPEDIDTTRSKNDHHNWLLEELPRYTPFMAQRGDRVIYLRDAHNIYIKYELKELLELYTESNCDVNQIDSAIGADRCIVKALVTKVRFLQNNYIRFSMIELQNIPEDSDIFCFNVIYRPNRGICDFLVLEKLFNDSKTRVWTEGSEFRSLWKKSWWTGRITGQSAFDPQYPDSPFKRYQIKWDTGEKGRLSSWDLFQIDPDRLPKRRENGVVINREDLLKINYKPYLSEWPAVENLDCQRWRYYELKRVYNGIKFIETAVDKSVVKLLEVPLNKEISYPIGLKLIKKRLKNLFYRRKEALNDDIEMLKVNAKLYIKPRDLKYGDDLVSLLLNIAKDTEIVNEEQWKSLLNNYPKLIEGLPERNSTNDGSHSCKRAGSSDRNSTKKRLKSSKSNRNNTSSQTTCKDSSEKNSSRRRSSSESRSDASQVTENEQWKADVQRFIDDLLRKAESEPYRRPVDPVAFPHYTQVIADPICIQDIQDKLNSNTYCNPIQVRVDFRLMYNNAKVFTKDPKSKMRQINKSLSHWSEDKLRDIVVDWQRVFNYEKKKKNSNGVKPREPTSRNQLWGYGAQQYY